MSSFIFINKASTLLSASSLAATRRSQLRLRQILQVSLILLVHCLVLGWISTFIIPKIVEYLSVAAHWRTSIRLDVILSVLECHVIQAIWVICILICDRYLLR